MANISFTLGTCDFEGKDYRFDFDNGKYIIYLVKEDSVEKIERFSDSKAAYNRWNELKRPEKAKR